MECTKNWHGLLCTDTAGPVLTLKGTPAKNGRANAPKIGQSADLATLRGTKNQVSAAHFGGASGLPAVPVCT